MDMETSEILKKVRRIEIKTRGISNHIFAGEYHSVFKGRGMSFAEVREYQFGDDIRNIDWNVTARSQKPYVKVFEEERELTMMLMVDISASSFFGSEGQFKSEFAVELCAVLAFSAIKNNDKVGLLLFSDEIELFIPPGKGKSHILRIIRELVDAKPRGKRTDLSMALRYFNNVVKKRSIAFVLSDFIDSEYDQALKIAAKRHDLTGVHLWDKRERELSKSGILRLVDSETGKLHWVNTNARKVRDRFRESFDNRRTLTQRQFRLAGSELLSIGCHEDYIKELIKYFKKRELKR